MKNIEINQSLHGYKNGHQLLACSIELPSLIKRTLLFQSDLSGSNLSKGFESYLSGYPIEGSNLYAFSRTWYADEMKRPGCVWTHTLLISYSDISMIPEFENLFHLFIRPIEGKYSVYNSPIKLGVAELAKTDSKIENLSAKMQIMEALFNNPNKTIIIPSNNSQKFEEIIVSIWSDLWPRLRRNFSFCTGALGLKVLDEHEFDIQIVPQSNISTIERQSRNPFIIDFNKSTSDWVNAIINYPKNRIRNFFWTFGSDIEGSRYSYKPLAELLLFLSQNLNILKASDVIKILSEKYPLQTEANNLKTTILTEIGVNNYSNLPKLSESDLLYALSTTSNFNSLDYSKLFLNERFQSLYNTNKNEFLNIVSNLTNETINIYGEEAIKIVAQKISEDDLEYINRNFKNLLPLFALLNPKLLYYVKFWKINSDEQQEVFAMLLKMLPENEIEWQKIFDILISIDAKIDFEIIDDSQMDLVSFILNWTENSTKSNLSTNWLNVLHKRPSEVLTWLNGKIIANGYTLDLILSVLNPNSRLVVSNGTDTWIKLLKSTTIPSSDNIILKLKAFSLALALNNPDKNSFELVIYSVESIFKALIHDNLPYSSWKYIEVHTKPLFWNNWDKSKKLAIALAEKSEQFKWNLNRLK